MENTQNHAGAMLGASFLQRMIIYVFFYIPFAALIVFATIMTGKDLPREFIELPLFIQDVIVFGTPMLPFILWEYFIRRFRRKHGLPIYKNVEEEIRQMEVNKKVAREKRAFEEVGVSQRVDKSDIGYWYDLFKKGAITEKEYEAKKAELL